MLELYGNRLMTLHLHDNNGEEDQHALPFTGTINWNNLKTKLDNIGYKGTISLEVRRSIGYEKISKPIDFLKIAAEYAGKI